MASCGPHDPTHAIVYLHPNAYSGASWRYEAVGQHIDSISGQAELQLAMTLAVPGILSVARGYESPWVRRGEK